MTRAIRRIFCSVDFSLFVFEKNISPRFLKFKGIAETGGQAKTFIQDGIVKVNGETCTARGKKIHGGDTVSVFSIDYKIITNEN